MDPDSVGALHMESSGLEQNSSDNLPSYLQTNIIAHTVT